MAATGDIERRHLSIPAGDLQQLAVAVLCNSGFSAA
jgi:hypothetical protein